MTTQSKLTKPQIAGYQFSRLVCVVYKRFRPENPFKPYWVCESLELAQAMCGYELENEIEWTDGGGVWSATYGDAPAAIDFEIREVPMYVALEATR